MARYLLDTNICIYIAKKHPPEVQKKFAKLAPGDVAMSAITFGEMHFGAHKSQYREQAMATLEKLKTAIPVLTLEAEVGQHNGEIRAELQRQGNLIGNNDVWIAAHARALGLVLVTNNEREFVRVPKLKVENWIIS